MKLVLQLIHVSDLHFASRLDGAVAKRAGPISRLFSLPWLAKGMMGHDAAALDQFEDALTYVLAERMLGTNLPPSDPHATKQVRDVSWIVCTGDLATFGDRHRQVEMAANWLADVATRKGIRYCTIYGNHDVWDCAIPVDRSESELANCRDDLRNTHFPATFPLVPVPRGMAGAMSNPNGHPAGGVLARLPISQRILIVTSLNTVLHERLQNTLAYGEVQQDYYWRQPRGPDQHAELQARAQPEEIRVVLTHHPVHFHGQPLFGMRLLNAAHVGMELSSRVSLAGGARGNPLATLVLSGHTHATFPPALGLPAQLPHAFADAHAPLGTDQLQLVAGTLSQRALGTSPLTHDFACLRFFERDDGVLELEREVWRRALPGPSGPFRPVGDRHGWVEPLVLG